MRSKPALTALLPIALAALLAGCGGGGDSTSTGGSEASGAETVKIADYEYAPADLTVPAGTTVTFANQDSAPHTATSKQSGAFDSGTIDGGKSGQITLEDAGSFAYFCAFHPFMKGKVTVE